jgi:lipoprotein-anchoring transpeptidase ErfK/SrfK
MAFRFRLPEEDQIPNLGLGRVTRDVVYIRSDPSPQGEKVGGRKRDQVITLLEEITSNEGPEKNPRWYRVIGGFVHSAYIQRVTHRLNKILANIPEKGQMGEVTIPYSQSFRYLRREGWQPLYRLYYQSVHWITGIDEGPDKRPWYQITDDLLGDRYYVPTAHLKPIMEDEITPISIDVPVDEKRIKVSLSNQTVTCYEGKKAVFHTVVSTGVGGPTTNGIPRYTPAGRFRISWKMPVRHMGEGNLTNAIGAYELPGVPWCCYFISTGVAFHGTYWHNNFGIKMSSGCVNMRPDEARWLFRWAMPINGPSDWYASETGTIVDVVD